VIAVVLFVTVLAFGVWLGWLSNHMNNTG